MKRVCFLILALALMLAGCGEDPTVGGIQQDPSGSAAQGNPQESTQSEVDTMYEIYKIEIAGEWNTDLTEHKETDDWLYSVYQKGDLGCVHVYQYKGTDRDIVVPDSFDGFPVTAVLDPRMYTVMNYDPDLQSFTRAYDISEITDIHFPDTVYKTYNMFHDTVWYQAQPDGLVYLGNILYAVKGESFADTNVTLRDGTLTVCEMAFYNQTGIETIIMPDSLVWIDDGAFRGCSNLREVQLSSRIISARSSVFAGCTNLTEIYIPKSLCTPSFMFRDSSIQTVYYEGSAGTWNSIWGALTQTYGLQVIADTPFPY